MKLPIFTLMLILPPLVVFSQQLRVESFNKKANEKLRSNDFFFENTIWHEDFNAEKWINTVKRDSLGYLLDTLAELPEGWKFIDSTNNNFFWHWSDVGPRGRYTSSIWDVPNNIIQTGLPQPNTAENGFLLLESDYFNTQQETGEPVDSFVVMNSYLEYGPINMSQAKGVIFNGKFMYRTCCVWNIEILLQISTNYNPITGSGQWENYLLNEFSTNATYTVPADREKYINISDQAAGCDSVYFRIIKKNATHYFVMVDDIRFFEPPTHNLVLNDAWAEYMYIDEDSVHTLPFQMSQKSFQFFGGYTQIPEHLIAPFLRFKSAVTNDATDTATNSQLQVRIFKDSVLDFEKTSSALNIPPWLSDTINIDTQYTPPGIGTYQVSLTVKQDSIDLNPGNNDWGYQFQVSYDTYSRVNHGNESNFISVGPRNWALGGYDGDICAQMFDIPETAENFGVKAIQVYFTTPHSNLEYQAIENGDFAMYARLYQVDENLQIKDLGISSELYTLSLNDTNTWITLELVDNGTLQIPGGYTYLAGIETYTGSTQNLRFEIGCDPSAPKQPLNGGLIFFESQNQWFLAGQNYAIDLKIVYSGPKNVIVSFNLGDINCLVSKGFFNPSTDTLFVYGSFNNWIIPGEEGSLMLSGTPGDSIYRASVMLQANMGEIQYKYYRNSGLEGGEWEGEPFRLATIADSDVVLLNYENCVTVKKNCHNDLKIYPNPFAENLVIESTEKGNSFIIYDMMGSIIKKGLIKESPESLNLYDLSEGLYFLTIIGKKGYFRTQIICKSN